MAIQLRHRRGTVSENNSFTGAAGEVVVDTTNNRLRVHDGATAGGFPIGEYVNVLDYGAIGDGVTNDTTALQAALDTGKSVYIPNEKTFLISAALQLNNNFVTIFGGGKILTTTNISYILQLTDVYGITIKDLVLESTYAENGTCAIFSNAADHVSNSTIDHVTIRGTQMGISIEGKDNSFNDENFTLGVYSTNLSYKSGLDAKNNITNCIIENSLTSSAAGNGGSPGIYLRGSFFNCSNNKIRNWYGPGILGGTDSIIANNMIINMVRENGIYASGAKRCTIVGNHIENVLTDCIAFNVSEDCVAIGNVLISNGNSLIRLQDTSSNISIVGNMMQVPTSTTTAYVRGYQNADYDGINNINFSGNVIDANNVAREAPLIIIPAPNGTYVSEHTNVNINNNKFKNVDCSLVPGGYYGSAIIYIQGAALNCKMSDNDFFNVVEYSTGSTDGGKAYFLGFDAFFNNNVVFTDLSEYRTPYQENLRVGIGASGSVTSIATGATDLIDTFVKGASTGEYDITFTQPVKVKSIGFHSSGTNKVDGISYDIVNPATSNDTVTSLTITLFNLNTSALEVPVWPHYNCGLLFDFELISAV